MKKPMKHVFLFVLTVLLLSSAAAWGQDPVLLDPKHFKVEVENAQVRVLRIHYNPHEKSPMHRHPASVEVSLTDQHLRITDRDGFIRKEEWAAGEIEWDPSETHAVENLSDKPMETVLVELKGSPTAGPVPSENDVLKVDPLHYRFEFEGDRLRVLRVHFGAHEKSPMHGHPASVVVSLTEYDVKFTLARGEVIERSGTSGKVLWLLPEEHSKENLADKPIEFAVIELKASRGRPRLRGTAL